MSQETISSPFNCFLVDYGVYWDCNLACKYCRKQPTRSADPNLARASIDKYVDGIDIVSLWVDAIMFKTSGWGEVTLVDGYKSLFKRAAELGFEVLQLITNGLELPPNNGLIKLMELGHFSIQLSLDGSTLHHNAYRFGSSKVTLDRVLYNLERCLSLGVPIEINSVLTVLNTGNFHVFLEYLLQLKETFSAEIMCVPRPVRVKKTLGNIDQLPGSDAIDAFERNVMERYDYFKPVLPAREYIEGVLTHLRGNNRPWMTFDAITRVNIGAHGEVIVHTATGNLCLGNIFADNPYQVFLERRRWHNLEGDVNYQRKLTQFDIHYLYFGGIISTAEMARVPSCANPVAQARLRQLRSKVFDAMGNSGDASMDRIDIITC